MPRPRKITLKKSQLQRKTSLRVSKPSNLPPILALPLEIFYMVTSVLSKEELKCLRATHPQLKEWVNPILFASVGINTSKVVEFKTHGVGAGFRAACVDKMYRAPFDLQGSEILGIPKRFYFIVGHRTTSIKDRDFHGGMSCLLRSFQTMLPRLLELFKAVEDVEVYLPVDNLRHQDSAAAMQGLMESVGTRRLGLRLTGVSAAKTDWLKLLPNLQSLSLCCGQRKNNISKAMVKLTQQAIQSAGSKLEHLELGMFENKLDDVFEGARGEALSALRTLRLGEHTNTNKDCHISAHNLKKLSSLDTLEIGRFSGQWLQTGSIWKELLSLGPDSRLRCVIVQTISYNLMEYLSQIYARRLHTLRISMHARSLESRGYGATDDSDCKVTSMAFFERSLVNLQGSLHTLSFTCEPWLDNFANQWCNKKRILTYANRARYFNFHSRSSMNLKFSELQSLDVYLMYYTEGARWDDEPNLFERFMISIQHSPKLRDIHLLVETLDFADDEDKWGVNSTQVINDVESFRCDGGSRRAFGRPRLSLEIHQLVSETKQTRFYAWDGTRWVGSSSIKETSIHDPPKESHLRRQLRSEISRGRFNW